MHRQIAQRLVDPPTSELLAQRLEDQARWLTVVGDEATAALTLAARAAVLDHQSDHPFIRALAWRSLLTAVADLAAQTSLRAVTS